MTYPDQLQGFQDAAAQVVRETALFGTPAFLVACETALRILGRRRHFDWCVRFTIETEPTTESIMKH